MRFVVVCCSLAMSAAAQVSYFSAYLDPASEVPPTASVGHGWGVVRFDAATNAVQLFCHHEGLTGAAIAAHMHQGAVGVNGGVIVGMSPFTADTWTGSGVLTPAQAAAMVTGGMYLNVHTAANGGGEIRGQVVTPRTTRFTAVMSGAQEVPPTPSTATGTVVAYLHEPDNRLVYEVTTTGLTGVLAAHFHDGPVGVAGPIVVDLGGGNGTYCGVSNHLSAAQVATLMGGGFYVNVHTIAVVLGEIRGQLRADVGDHFFAICNGGAETPPVPSPGLGSASLILGPDGTATVDGAFTGLTSGAIAAHVHVGVPGVAGPIVFPLTFAGGVLHGTYTPTAGDLATLRAGNWYVNVHSATFGGGEIRGQLGPATLPTVYGEGCPSSSGAIPHQGAVGFACMGTTFGFELHGVPAGSFSLMFVADNRDPSPVELPFLGIGAPGCFALITSNLLQFVQVADALGCAHQPVPVPLVPSLRNIPLYSQWATLDAVNPANIVTSNGLSFFIH